ncbi:CoA-binding protein [Alicyclobacillus pomorum]|jgi:predicted CoA-binding protein|uniref:CoA-binding protein n=1 Tax=Alicyclobacillus pomorum TaxID=204470 RepID=UPI00047C6646|nr:CoA-binding protein [Alicyclobacillus pomorum]
MMSDEAMADLLSHTRLIASVGLVNDPSRPSYEVAKYQQSQGYKVIPVNPNEDSVLGHKAVDTVSQIEEPIDVVNVFVHGRSAPAIAQAAVRAGAKALWLQPGVDSPEAVQTARAAGLTVVSNKCFMREHQRLLSESPQ